MTLSNNRSLNRNQLKYLVIVAMVIDHIAWAWVPTASLLGQLMHTIGRLTGPTMAYFLVEGYTHTKNVNRYTRRLALFALISWPAFCLYEFGALPIRVMQGVVSGNGIWTLYNSARNITVVIYPYFGVIYTLFLSLVALRIWDSKWDISIKVIFISFILFLSTFGDWAYFDIIWALIFLVFKNRHRKMWIFYGMSAIFVYFINSNWETDPLSGIFQFGVFLVPILIGCFYNGQGGSRKGIHKWFFYIFYPAHLLLLAALKTLA